MRLTRTVTRHPKCLVLTNYTTHSLIFVEEVGTAPTPSDFQSAAIT